MTDLDELKALHKRWCLGNDKAAETVCKRLPDLIERVEKAEAERVKLETKVYGYQERDRFTTLEQTRLNARISELEAAVKPFADEFRGMLAIYGEHNNSTGVPIMWGHLRNASRALGADHE